VVSYLASVVPAAVGGVPEDGARILPAQWKRDVDVSRHGYLLRWLGRLALTMLGVADRGLIGVVVGVSAIGR
jgi:hypothetical protein